MAGTFPGKNFPVQEGDLLSSTTCIYVVQTFLGKGSYGTVAKCRKRDTTETVAIKILKGRVRIKDAEKEVAMLNKLCQLDPDKDNFVRWHDYFLHNGHPCLVFEVMDIDLNEFMERRDWMFLPLSQIRPITQQIAVALKAFKRIGVMHCDLKPKNIMLVDCVQQPLRVKVIDFGMATPTADAKPGSRMQTLSYRAPEILLGLPFSEAIDMWSLGCVIVELFLGELLYPAYTEYDMIRYIIQTHGKIPRHLLDAGVHSYQFFFKITNMESGFHSWRLKAPIRMRSGISTRDMVDNQILHSVDDLVKLRPGWIEEQIDDTRMFVDLVKRMLTLDAAGRITPSEALQHRFVTMNHLLERYPNSFYLDSCSKALDICTRQEESFERCAAVDTQAEKNSPIALAEDCSETETPVTPATQQVKAPSLLCLPQESKAVDFKDPISLLHETKEIQTPSSLSQEIKPLASQQQVKTVDKVPTRLVQEPANLKPAGPVGPSVKGHLSVKQLKERKKYGCFSRLFPTRVNKVNPAGPECSIIKDDLSTTPEKERGDHGCFSWLLSPIRRGKQRLTQWLEKQRGFHCRPSQNNK